MSRLTRLSMPVLVVFMTIGLAWVLLANGAMRDAARPAPDSSGTAVTQLYLEFAGTPDRAGALLDQWGARSQERLRKVILLDFDFIPAYVLLLGSLVLMAGRASNPDSRLSTGLLVGMILAAGALDVIENAAMLAWLADRSPPGAIPFATVMAAAKWLLLLFAFVAATVKLYRSIRVSPAAPSSPAPGS